MPKTIHSKRDPLTSDERKAYGKNLETAKTIRKEFLKEFPEFNYGQVYTEARKGGACRTKFYRVGDLGKRVFSDWMKKQQAAGRFANASVKLIEHRPYISMGSISITIGKK